MTEVLAEHPFLLLLGAWVASRLQIVVGVRNKLGPSEFDFRRYLQKRWVQMIHSGLWTLVAYTLVVATDAATWLASTVPTSPKPTPEAMLASLAFACAVGADQVVDRITSIVVRGRNDPESSIRSPSAEVVDEVVAEWKDTPE